MWRSCEKLLSKSESRKKIYETKGSSEAALLLTDAVRSSCATNKRRLVKLKSILGDPGALSRVGRKGGTKVFNLKTFVPPFLPTRMTSPGSPRMVEILIQLLPKCITSSALLETRKKLSIQLTRKSKQYNYKKIGRFTPVLFITIVFRWLPNFRVRVSLGILPGSKIFYPNKFEIFFPRILWRYASFAFGFRYWTLIFLPGANPNPFPWARVWVRVRVSLVLHPGSKISFPNKFAGGFFHLN